MEKTDIHPDVLLQELLAKNPRKDKAEKLRQLNEICADHHAQNKILRDFTLPSIGRLCRMQGLFKTERTLYNACSKDYCDLINAWAAYSGSSSVKISKGRTELPTEHLYLLKIEDHALRSIMQSVIAQRDKLKQQLDIVKSQIRIQVDQRPAGTAVAINESPQFGMEHMPILTDSERNALKKAISLGFMEDQGWVIGSDGEVYADSGAVVFEPGFVTAIKKITDGRA